MTMTDYDLDELLDLLGKCFGSDKTEYFRRVITLDPERGRGRTFLRRNGGKLVAAVQVFSRRARWGNSGSAAVGVIGNVATEPEYRGQGLAGSLLDEAMGWMRIQGCDFGLLFTGLQGYYERWGWTPAPYHFLTVPTAAKVCPGRAAALHTVRRMEHADLPTIGAIHEVDPGADSGPFFRTPLYWRSHFQWLSALGREQPEACMVAVPPGRSVPVAYIRCGVALAEQRLRVLEAGSAAGADGYGELLASVFDRAKAEGLSAVELLVPPGHPILAMLDQARGAQWLVRWGPMLHDLGRPDALNPPLARVQPFFWQTDWC